MRRGNLIAGLIIGLGLILYIVNQSRSIYGGDGGDLVSAALVGGIPHPPGYPLYTLLGFLLTKISIHTPAWRVAFLSSISSILTLLIFFRLVKLLLKEEIIALLTTLTLACMYLFWIYSIVPEVFALNNLFVVLLIYLFLNFSQTKKLLYLYLWSFFLGLSLTHHHTIVLLLPASFYFFVKNKNLRQFWQIKYLAKCFFFFALGLLPYLYLPIAASFLPSVNWENPQTFANFFRLVTRSGYGTFKIGGYLGDTPFQRILSLIAAFKYFLIDFRPLGSFLILAGFYTTLKKKKNKENKNYYNYYYLSLLVLTSLFFIFYASFPLYNDFLVGTFERFLLFPEILLTLFFAAGLKTVVVQIHKIPLLSRLSVNIIYSVFLVIPLGLFILNYPKITILKNDSLPEKLAVDILNSLEPNSILVTSTDTNLFALVYLYHWQKKWPQIKIIHPPQLAYPHYRAYLKTTYPDLDFPAEDKETFVRDFFEENGKKLPFYSTETIDSLTGQVIPFGLVQRYYPKEIQVPPASEVIKKNNQLWLSYQNPLDSSLRLYKNLLPADVLRVYAIARQNYGQYLLEQKEYQLAENEFRSSLKLASYNDTRFALGQALLSQNKCQEALDEFLLVFKNEPTAQDALLIAQTYGDCLKNEEKKKEFLEIYQKLLKKEQTPLKKL